MLLDIKDLFLLKRSIIKISQVVFRMELPNLLFVIHKIQEHTLIMKVLNSLKLIRSSLNILNQIISNSVDKIPIISIRQCQ
jgi:hypothetical protein